MFADAIYIDNGKILLSRITVFVDLLDVIPTLTVLLKQHFVGVANHIGGKSGGIVLVDVGLIFYTSLFTLGS